MFFPGSVLCYHGLTAAGNADGGAIHVSVDLLRSVVATARRLGEVIPLRELVQRHLDGRSTKGLVALTFDDAYISLATHARELIEREQVPITTFAVVDALSQGSTFWWDRLEEVFARATPKRWTEFENELGVPDDYRRGQPEEFGRFRPVRQWILSMHRGRWTLGLESALAAIEVELECSTTQRSMTREELASFSRLPGVDVGVHTLSHPVLPLLPDEELATEVRDGYRELQEVVENPVPILAIPFGLFDDRTVTVARMAGMKASLTLESTTLGRAANRDFLPRIFGSRGLTPWRFALHASSLSEKIRGTARNAPRYPDLPSATT